MKDPQIVCNDISEIFKKLGPYFQALGDPIRQQIITLLIQHEKLNVTSIAQHIDLSRPAISHHLKYLKINGLIDVQKKGTEMYYYLVFDEVMQLLKELVTSVSAFNTVYRDNNS